ncbi:hypothetical protein [Acinetobacter sp. YH01009]|uniref:hypothetical protein n=1 Tax=Acinetobacter TaxID=469 RepID=UPI0015D20BF0|nr:hypothetical protein [Acinetobacter sp. YH01009]
MISAKKFEKMFILLDKKNSFLSGATLVLSMNVIFMLALLFMILIMKSFWDNAISFSFFLMFLYNIQVFTKMLYNSINYKVMGLHVHKNEVGQLVAALLISIFIGLLSIQKFDLLPVTKESYAPLFINIFCTAMILVSPVSTYITRILTNKISNEPDVYDLMKKMSKSKLIMINILYFIVPLSLAVTLVSILKY